MSIYEEPMSMTPQQLLGQVNDTNPNVGLTQAPARCVEDETCVQALLSDLVNEVRDVQETYPGLGVITVGGEFQLLPTHASN